MGPCSCQTSCVKDNEKISENRRRLAFLLLSRARAITCQMSASCLPQGCPLYAPQTGGTGARGEMCGSIWIWITVSTTTEDCNIRQPVLTNIVTLSASLYTIVFLRSHTLQQHIRFTTQSAPRNSTTNTATMPTPIDQAMNSRVS